MITHNCKNCGGELEKVEELKYRCPYCGTTYYEEAVQKEEETLASSIDAKAQEIVSNLRQELYKKVNATYNDSAEILRLCREIKIYLPDDFFANFYETANMDNEDEFVKFLEGIDVEECYSEMEAMLNYALKSISPKNMLAICNLIERAYKQKDLSLYNEFRTKYDEQCKNINDCVYDPSYPRDAFICYSSKDMAHVESLVKFLEEQGLLCFVAIRNLQHGRAAVQNYWNAIHTAIENCKCIVFLSSTNSRSMHCDALQELRYVLALEQKLNKKIKKIEFLLENYTGEVVERNFKRVFEGLEYCYDQETVYDRIVMGDEDIVIDTQPAAPAAPAVSEVKEVKFCRSCGQENPDGAKFCLSCGKDEFVATKEDYIEYLKQALAEQSRHPATPEPAPAVDYGSNYGNNGYGNNYGNNGYGNNNNYGNNGYSSGNQSRRDPEQSYDYIPPSSPIPQGQPSRRDKEVIYMGNDFTDISKGQHIVLPEGVRKARVTIKNEYKLDNVVADLYMFLLDNTERVLCESDLVFHGNPASLNNSVKVKSEGGEDVVDISFNKVNQDITKIRFILSVSDEQGRVRNFSMIRSSIIIIRLEDQAFRLDMSDVGRFESVCAFDFYRIRDRWKLNVQVAGFRDDIATLCGNYGIDVE